ncbi:MAG TPA: proline--tRNA ligase [Kiritimatiellia bacterium]|mgnify:FL=1|nr:proline--tRNA ligase [Kiritimatiellia bacterium]HMP34173.1 proline--tRNA ligase [Kiritimatiellia bacterium]
MRWSKQFIPTLREVPQEAEIPSHQLMLRAGLIRKLSGGLYTFLPLGVRALRKVERIVREEMDRAGALEILMPALQPQEIWEESGRFEVLKHVMFRMKDRQDRPMVLGPTHEEVVTGLAVNEINSYRQLPRNFYQIQTKFRDEIRPRFGLMRAKEFIMKDAYSFDIGWDEADVSYKAMYEAYVRIFQRCGLRVKVVEADTGAMGGKSSHEFMVLADAGEDGLVECDTCSYAANLEQAVGRVVRVLQFGDAAAVPTPVATPNRRTIEEVSSLLKVPAAQFIKTLIYASGDQVTAVLVPGDREVNEIKLRKLIGAGAELATPEVIRQVTGAPVGFAGPIGLTIPVIADLGLKDAYGMITGGNQADVHLKGVNMMRDVPQARYEDVVNAKGGDGCPRCGGTLKEARGIEVGHVFKLGTKYSEKLGATFLDAQGGKQTMVMGCYGIGVTRTLQSVIEQSHDAQGIIWPVSIAPYQVAVMAINAGHAPSVEVVEKLVEGLSAVGVDVVYDDRDERPGVKFKDADLVGIPVRVCVGERSLAKGEVEIKVRKTGEVSFAPVDQAITRVVELIRQLDTPPV